MTKVDLGASADADRAATPSEPSPAVSGKAGIPSAAHYATLVFNAPTDELLTATVKPIFDLVPFSSEADRPRIVAASWSLDAMSVLDAVSMVAENMALDPYETLDCIREVAELRTWEECLAKFAEWKLDLRDGELVEAGETA
jgi:hypothetical protein